MRTVFVLFLIILVSGCKVKKNMIDDSAIANETSAKKIARKHLATYLDKKTIDSKFKVNFNNGKTRQGLTVSMRMEKDKFIWLKGSKLITVFKAKITPSSVEYYSPVAKNYFVGDFKMIESLLGVSVNFEQLQNLFLGQAIQNLKEVKQDLKIENNKYLMSPKEQSDLFNLFFTLNPSHFKLDNQFVIDTKNNTRMDVVYPSYQLVQDEIYPTKIIVKSKGKKSYTEIDFTLRSVEFNQPLQVPFRIPGGYKQLTL